MNTTTRLIASLVLAGAALAIPSAFAGTPPTKAQSVTLTPIAKSAARYEGTLSNKHILMVLSQEGANFEGAYAYVKQGSQERPRWIDLFGSAKKDGVVSLVEKVNGKVTGSFSGKIAGNGFSGTWQSPAGRRLDFSASAVPATGDLAIVAHIETSGLDAKLKRIDIYRDKKLAQSFPADADIFTSLEGLHYDDRDVNFDGYPDLAVPIENGEQLHWLFDPARNRYLKAPASLQGINVTSTQYSTDEVYEEWSSGMNIYKYVGGKYCLTQENIVSGEAGDDKISEKTYPVSHCKGKR
ncbi:hypothetical protein [Massilia sp. Root335]|uniref:hypothetical protein n=1 Tax=Massilia sp. Root335 TaxID=1736517 RepID=UPI0012F6CB60|nr:hypothetical protein [Massilia sp. Root335]